MLFVAVCLRRHPARAVGIVRSRMDESSPNKLKHLDYLQAVIARMAQNSFLFKGWAVTLASGLAAVGAVKDQAAVLAISLAASALFWGMDAYYLWLERGFIELYERVAESPDDQVDFSMRIDKRCAFCRWLRTCLRPHLLMFYGVLIVCIVVGIAKFSGGK